MVRGGARNVRNAMRRGSAVYVPVETAPPGDKHYPMTMFEFAPAHSLPQYVYEDRGFINRMSPSFYTKSLNNVRNRRRGGYMMPANSYITYQPAFSGRLRRRQPIILDRRRRAPFMGRMQPPRINQRMMQRRSRGGMRRPRRGRPGGNNVGKADLDAQLDAYMGDNATKSRLDSQLDLYFGRAATEKVEPLSDPSDINMEAPPTRT